MQEVKIALQLPGIFVIFQIYIRIKKREVEFLQFNKQNTKKFALTLFALVLTANTGCFGANDYFQELDAIRGTLAGIEDKNSDKYFKYREKLLKFTEQNKIDYSRQARLNDVIRLINVKKYDIAIYELRLLIEENYQTSKCYEILGDICLKIGKPLKRAGHYYRLALTEDGKNYAAAFKLATLYIRENKTTPGITYLSLAVENCNNTEFLNRMLQYIKNNVNMEDKYEANNIYEILGKIYLKLNQKNNAIEAFKTALKINPEDIFLKYYLSDLLYCDNYDKDAIALYDSILNENPKETAIRTSKAKALASDGSILEAEREYRRILKENPNSKQAKYGLYKLYERKETPEKIIEKVNNYSQTFVATREDILNFAKFLKEVGDIQAANNFISYLNKREQEEKERIEARQRLVEEENLRREKILQEKVEQKRLAELKKQVKRQEEQKRLAELKKQEEIKRIEAEKQRQEEIKRQEEQKRLAELKKQEELKRIEAEKQRQEEIKRLQNEEKAKKELKIKKEKEEKLKEKLKQEQLKQEQAQKEAELKKQAEKEKKQAEELKKQKEYEEKTIVQERQKAQKKDVKKYNQLDGEIKKYLATEPKDAKTYIAIANTYKMLEMPTSAIKYYKEAQKLDAANSDIYYNLGLTYMELNSFVTAKANLTKAINLDKDNAKAKNLLGFVNQKLITQILNKSYAKFEAKDYVSAFEILDDGIKEYPKQGQLYYYRALVYDKMNRNAAQIIDLQKAIELDPGYYMAYYQLGIAYEKINDEKSALVAYEKFLSTEPDEKDLIEEVQKKVITLGAKYY